MGVLLILRRTNMKIERCKEIVKDITGEYPRNVTTSFLNFVRVCEKPKHLKLCALRHCRYYIIPSISDNPGEVTTIYMPWFWMFAGDLPVYFLLHETLHQQNPFMSEEAVTMETKRRYGEWKVSRLKSSKKSSPN